MLKTLSLLLAAVFIMTQVTPLLAAVDKFDAAHSRQMDEAAAEAIAKKETPGAVIVAGTSKEIFFAKAYGHFTYDPKSTAVTLDTDYDMASLSKVLGTAPSIMILWDRHKLDVNDPVAKYIPGVNRPDKKDITIANCLTHSSGFEGDNPMSDYKDGPQAGLEGIWHSKLRYPTGKGYVYSDLNFITLGEVVKAVSGEPLNKFAEANVFGPLKMTHTTYLPPKSWDAHCAPTQKRDGHWMQGEVHDPRAHALGGFAGHAGVFSTGPDVARFCQMILNKGELDGVRILSAHTIEEMTKERCVTDADGKKFCRGYGFDIDTPYSYSPRGSIFPKGKSFGHTGYTGTSLWIDPVDNCFIVVLTNRVYPDDKASISPLRRHAANIAAEAMGVGKK